MVHGVPGPTPQTAKREQFARLIAQGTSSAEACRIVGVNPRTGKRWRHGRTITSSSGVQLHYLPVINARKSEISARYLSEDERVRIADLRRAGLTVRRSPPSWTAIRERSAVRCAATVIRPAASTGRSPCSGWRWPVRARPGRGKLLHDPVFCEFVQGRLKKRWSPEQISHALRGEFPDQSERRLSIETIYQAIYRPELGGLGRELRRVLRTGRLRRKPHRRPDARRAGSSVAMTMIGRRPAEAADRSMPGHWEGDLITGENNASAIGTLVERRSRATILLHLPGRHTAEAVRDAVVAAMAHLPARLRRSLTWDQGKELALHADIATALNMPVFFCDAHSPWQRPSNENTNGLLRQYFPKGSDLRKHSAEDLVLAAAELNDRPRKTLGWDTPAARFGASLTPRSDQP